MLWVVLVRNVARCVCGEEKNLRFMVVVVAAFFRYPFCFYDKVFFLSFVAFLLLNWCDPYEDMGYLERPKKDLVYT